MDADKTARAASNLLNGALRLRRSGDGVYGEPPPHPITKPAEAIGAWIASMTREIDQDVPFSREAEMREVLLAAGEEVDAAMPASTAAARLRDALYRDAIDTVSKGAWRPPRWVLFAGSAALGGLLGGLLVALLSRRR